MNTYQQPKNLAHYGFDGRCAVVTGASGGIGQAICAAMIRNGANAVNWDRAAGPVAPGGAVNVQVDITDPESIAQAHKRTLEQFGKIDFLINNAGFSGATDSVVESDPGEWARIIEVNLLGTYRMCRQVVPEMIKRNKGRIVNIASLAGKEGTPNSSAYSASKAGVIALTKSLGKELAHHDILVNAIAPAAVNTELLKQMGAEHVATMLGKSPMGRLGEPAEVAELVLWLCSGSCSFSTGAVFDLSGGRATY